MHNDADSHTLDRTCNTDADGHTLDRTCILMQIVTPWIEHA